VSSLSGTPFAEADEVGMWILPTEETNATISILCASFRYFSAMAPAATRPACQIMGNGKAGTDGFPGRAASSAAACFYPVFLEIGPVCVTWTGIEIHFRVVVGSLVEILDEHSNRCAECRVELCARLDLYSVLLISLELVRSEETVLAW
jgi:hypothetical protein